MRTITKHKPANTGFTLVELLIVMLIISILIGFVLAVSFSGLEAARRRATQSLITKLSVAVEDRMEAILATQVSANGTHKWLASILPPNLTPIQQGGIPWGIQSDARAAIIARLDLVKAEFPDVFFIDYDYRQGTQKFYPVNFAALPFPLIAATNFASAPTSFVLPLGNSISPGYTPATGPPSGATGTYSTQQLDPDGDGVPNLGPGNLYGNNGVIGNPLPVINPSGTGILGASYNAAASLYQLIGYTPMGYDGVDNNGDGFVDDLNEGTSDQAYAPGSNQTAVASVNNFILNHRHKTARSEMLYALLINGKGPLGSAFTPEDFTSNEVQDTDGDGVPEFVDAWGEPLQFYRWPIYHDSPIQKGFMPPLPYGTDGNELDGMYTSALETRQLNPLDSGKQLTGLQWWSSLANLPASSTNVDMSLKADLVQSYFVSLAEDPLTITAAQGVGGVGHLWERSSDPTANQFFRERAWFSKFLIVSSGADRALGKFVISDATIDAQASNITAGALISGESRAAFFDPDMANDPLKSNHTAPDDDDLDNQNLQNKIGGLQ